MTLAASHLRPYASLVLLQIHGRAPKIRDLVSECEQAMPFADDPQLNPVAGPIYPRRPGLDLGALVYEERRPPAWLGDSDEIRDLVNHLLVVARRDRLVALYMSDPRRRAAVLRRLEATNGGRSWHLEAIDPGLLNAAFVRGPARTLWLSGIHVQVTSRADSKVLSGMDLRDALDPLGDQTYYFTAARSTVPELGLAVGVSPRGSRVWVGASSTWENFCHTLDQVFDTLGESHEPDPLPVVAVPIEHLPDLFHAFDLHLIPPELLAEDAEADGGDRELVERWALRSSFRVLQPGDPLAEGFEPPAGPGVAEGRTEVPIPFEVDLEGRSLALACIVLDVTDPGRVAWTIEVRRHPDAVGDPDQVEVDLEELRKVLRRRRWLRVWFESGHTLSDGVIFEVRHRDLPFVGYTWADFHDYQVKTEKFWSKEKFPGDAIQRIGKCGSLFCWLHNHWPPEDLGDSWTDGPPRGWLTCDDGAMEIADFIHLDDAARPPILSLVHVKGAKSKKPDRGISVSAYEVVVGQAVKNLRFLDRLSLAGGIQAGLGTMIGKLVWHDGVAADRDGMIEALGRIGASYRRRVIVLQPQVTERSVEEARKAAAKAAKAVKAAEDRGDTEAARVARAEAHKGDVGRLRQLDTLLLAAEASAHGLGAELFVIGDGAARSAPPS